MIFVDTSFWIALHARRDRRHDEARALLSSHPRSPLLTSNHVVGETWTFAARRYGHGAAARFLHAVRSTPRVEILFVDQALESEAWEWLRSHDERPYSFVDATSFACMRRHGVHEAFAFDRDFAAAGFVELRG